MYYKVIKSVHNQIFNRIVKNRRGIIIFPSDFYDVGDDDAVRKALSRLQKEKVLERLAHGIYLYPKKDPVFGILYPSTEEIAEHIAERDHARIIPTGAAALNKVGLSTQVPMNVTYLTDGAPRKIKIGKQTITFKSTTAKKLSYKGKVSALVIQALQELGKEAIDSSVLNHLEGVLRKENDKNLKHDAALAPVWISKILIQLTVNK
jgi:hypothetical protein